MYLHSYHPYHPHHPIIPIKSSGLNAKATFHYVSSYHICHFLGFIPSDPLQNAEIPFWNNIQAPFPRHNWDMHIITMWNTKGRNCLNACNRNWFKYLAKEIPEAKWEINYIHNDPNPLCYMDIGYISHEAQKWHLSDYPFSTFHSALRSKNLLALLKEKDYPVTTFIKPHKALKIETVCTLDPPQSSDPNTASAQTWSVKY